MDIYASKRGPKLSVRLVGELDHHSADKARVMMDTMLHDLSVRELVMDFSDVSFMDSAGLGTILGRYRKLALRGGKLTVTGVSDSIDRIFRMSGLYALVERR
ncbi:MAG TPA: anti-sigma factor antagonist [Eubacteriales bacterium]|nr:anti-sigma factor antagonist [Clostridia bacterium]HRV72658.1 anti-sigma factor antagonist [Eubacteriales bacterium]